MKLDYEPEHCMLLQVINYYTKMLINHYVCLGDCIKDRGLFQCY